MAVDSVLRLKQQKAELISKYSKSCNIKAWVQMLNTIVPYLLLWYFAAISLQISYWLTALCIFFMVLFLLRMFVLMHESGHNSLFRNSRLNKVSGIIFGVFSGMPQYVWSQRHNFHHSTNGNWSKYRGPLGTLSTDEFSELSTQKQKSYVRARKLMNAPLAGFMYLIFNPRFTWVKGSLLLIRHLVLGKLQRPSASLKTIAAEFKSTYWSSAKEYRCMTFNNLMLISIWLWMSFLLGPLAFFIIYIISLSLAGASAIILFAAQHNFEHAYASDDEGWDYYQAALHGTSYLKLPKILNWFTANIGYHHVHHLSVRIPNYLLQECHQEYRHLFVEVPRINLSKIMSTFDYILWDIKARRIISVKEFYERSSA
ncbi:MAG: fatty acid desaturase [Gammaproteobacteria bacterium]|nr:MAG: fatty acid desaturase [Gammaproteobacteria bacterium]